MRRKTLAQRGWFVVFMACMLVGGLGGTRSAYAASATVENPEVTTGGTLVVRASGFRGNEDVVTWVSSARGTVYATESGSVDRQGNVTINIKIKRFWEPGYWAVTVHGLRSGREGIGTFIVQTGPPDGPLLLSSPTVAPGGTLHVRGDGFRSGELVSAWVTRPDGTTEPVPESPLRPDGGRIQFTYAIPYGAQLGVWAVTAYGNGSDLILVSQFTVER